MGEYAFHEPKLPEQKSRLKEFFSQSPLASGLDSSPREEYRVRLSNFEGPLDLLLHLIHKEQINIYDIPVARICKSYLEHLELLSEPDINVAGEFMVMAATLTHLKSQVLLPQEEMPNESEDPRLPLVAQLLEYERFKKAACTLDALNWLDRDLYARHPASAAEVLPQEALRDGPIEPVEVFQLLVCLKQATDRTSRVPITFQADAISLREKVLSMGAGLEGKEIVNFSSFVVNPHVNDLIVCFLAILELARLRFVEIIQHENFGPIHLRSVRSIRELDMGLLEQF